jgi:hypothetical protein
MKDEALKLALEGAANYIDALGGDSRKYRQALAAPVQEPVAWANPNDLKNFDMKVRTNGGPLHTVPLCLCTPPAAQRQWVGLTHDEFIDLCEEAGNFGSGSLIRHIEAKLKEKNT